MINWKVRMKNKMFWVALIPVLFLLTKQVLDIFGVQVDLDVLQIQLTDLVETIFILLGILGIVQDPTTKGVADSDKAMEYTEPK